MAINLKFDLMSNPEPPSIVLANRNGNKLGQLNVNVESIDVKDKFNDISEFSFTLNKYIDGEPTPLWDKVVDFKLVNCPEWDLWFEIKVELDEATETVKTVYCTQLGQAELSQIMIYNTEINTEADIEREDYKTSILYDEKNPKSSILHRLLEKAPHYSIAYVDESIQRIQRQFSFDGVSICDAFNEIAEEIGCLFVYNSNSQTGGKPNRTISVYDLQQNCNNKDCKHRGEFTDKCPKCGNTDITYGYGEDTLIFVTADELASEGIQLVTDTDSVKNCFKLEAGDDLMTATIRNCNPNGSDYIWYFSDSMKEDMSKELVDRIEGYDELYKEHYNSHISQLNGTLVNQYNNLVAKYDDYYNAKSTCLDCKNEGDFEEQCPKCNSKNILTGQKLQTIPTTITGYPALMTAYYNTIDLLLYLESGLMPNVEMSDTTAEEQVKLLTTSSLSPVAVNVKDIKNASEATANSAVLSMAKVLIRPTYKVAVVDGSSSLSEVDTNGEYKTWIGKFVVTNYSDDKDTAESDTISVRINNATETFIEQKIDKALNKENTDDYSITGLFAKDYDDFCEELKRYALNPLDSFSKACDTCISILTEQGAGDEDGKPDLYAKLYKPYFDKQQAINDEIKVRESEIAIIEGVWDMSDDNNPKCTTKGLQQYIEDCQKEIQDALNFEGYLGEDLWLEFCAYRREDKYSNSNYISDGLDNAELFKKANEFIEVAKEEIFKSAELQHSISATLNNLLSLPKFKPLLKSFKTGNWIRVQIDEKVYKLRLLEYDFGYGDSKNINVEFSDVTKIKNGMTDVQDVFEQASSMASSYDSVQRQAQKGNVARSTIDQWIIDGLDSADVQIKSNDSEEILLTKSGLLARSYDDITGTYLPEQFKLTHNIMAYTTDNWETVSSALGKHKYTKWNGSSFIDDEDYGLSAKFAQAAYIIGSQVIGGEIVSSNYQPKQRGTHINLLNGDFDFAGGKITYDAEDNNVTLKGVTIQWDGEDAVNPPAVQDVTGLSDEIEKINTINSALSPTTINGNSVVSPLIVGGYLNIKNETDKTGVVIDPNRLVNDEYIFRVYKGNITAIGLDVNGNAEFSGTIKSSKVESTDIVGSTIIGGTITAGNTLYIGSQKDEDGNIIENSHSAWIDVDGVLNTNEAHINGTITAIDGMIGGFTIEPTETAEDGSKSGGWLYSGETIGADKSIFLSATDMDGNADFFDETINDWRVTVGSQFGITSDGTTYMSNCEITGGSLRMGNVNDGYSAWISVDDGILNASGANINGKITATEGAIGKCTINTDGSIVSANGNFSVDAQGNLTAVGGGSIGGFTIGDTSIYKTKTSYNDTASDGVYLGTDGIGLGKGKFSVNASGDLVATNADIAGVITATTGYIGYQDDSNVGWTISPNKISGGGVSLYTGDDYIEGVGTDDERKVRISVGTNNDLNSNPFKVFHDGYIVASNGIIGSCNFHKKRYPVVDEDLANPSGHKITATYEGVSLKLYFEYAVRYSPSDSYSIKTFTPYSYDRYTGSATEANSFVWYWAWTNSPTSPPSTWNHSSRFDNMDTSIIETAPYFWLKCLLAKETINSYGDIETTDLGNAIYYIGDFSGYLTIFSFGENSLMIGEDIITGKTSSIKFEDTLGRLSGTWYYGDAEIATSSWRGAKSNIEELDDRYSILFDELRPVRFTYNNGQSNRYHTGIILDELKAAMDEANVDTSELAAYCISDETTGEGGIRYSEFISLCIDQIQKLKVRVVELENKLGALE